MNRPDITIGCVSNIWSRQMHFKKTGDTELGHKHTYDHLTLLAHGKLKVTVNNKDVTIFEAPHMIFIEKDTEHMLEALVDNTVAYCIHALRDKDKSGDILDPNMIPAGIQSSEPILKF